MIKKISIFLLALIPGLALAHITNEDFDQMSTKTLVNSCMIALQLDNNTTQGDIGNLTDAATCSAYLKGLMDGANYQLQLINTDLAESQGTQEPASPKQAIKGPEQPQHTSAFGCPTDKATLAEIAQEFIFNFAVLDVPENRYRGVLETKPAYLSLSSLMRSKYPCES